MLMSTEQAGILRWTLLHRCAVLAVLFLSSTWQLPFDSSAWIQLQLDATSSPILTSLALPLLRWDTLHFLGMASPRPLPLPLTASSSGQDPSQARGGGLQYEHSFAFQPGIVWLLRILGSQSFHRDDLRWSPSQAVILTSVLATIVGALQPLLLYRLTKRLTGDERQSRMAAYLSILSPSPCSLVTPTPESFFSLFALLGHLCLATQGHTARLTRLISAAGCYALATMFRANGILLVGFILWNLFWQHPRPSRLTLLCAPALVLISVSPLLVSQGFAFARFCSTKEQRSEWCKRMVPNVYSFVQSQYWNVSPFGYWTISQLPNWLLALPALSLATSFALFSYTKDLPSILTKTLTPWRIVNTSCNQRMLAHIHFTLVTLLILLVSSHVQIVLRFASPGSLPAVWWGASHLVLQHYDAKRPSPRAASFILPYLVLWNLTSVVLYSGFYPPA